MGYSTLISFYGAKSPAFAALIDECQSEVAAVLRRRFQPYDRRQVHCTIAALDRVGNSGLMNAGYQEFRGTRIKMDLAALIKSICAIEPMEIRIGGFAEADAPFLSRGQRPYRRSFSMQDGKAVIMGWPIDRSTQPASFPPSLDTLRRGLQRFGVLHRYYAKDADVDNDFYLRIGLYDPANVARELKTQVEQRLREFLRRRPAQILSLGVCELAFAQSEYMTLPPESTRQLPMSTPDVEVSSLYRLFGWEDLP